MGSEASRLTKQRAQYHLSKLFHNAPEGNKEDVEKYIRLGADIECRDGDEPSALSAAAHQGRKDVVERSRSYLFQGDQ